MEQVSLQCGVEFLIFFLFFFFSKTENTHSGPIVHRVAYRQAEREQRGREGGRVKLQHFVCCHFDTLLETEYLLQGYLSYSLLLCVNSSGLMVVEKCGFLSIMLYLYCYYLYFILFVCIFWTQVSSMKGFASHLFFVFRSLDFLFMSCIYYSFFI